MPSTTFKYVAFGVSKGVYAEGQWHDYITVNWHVVNDQFTVDSIVMPNRSNPSWLWYRMNVEMVIAVGNTSVTLFDTNMTNVTNSTRFSYLGILCDDFANRALPRTFTITTENTNFGLRFGGTTTPVFSYADGGGYSVQDSNWLPMVGGQTLSPIPVQLKYRPGARRISGRMVSINRGTGSARKTDGTSLYSQDGGKAVAWNDMCTYADTSSQTWRRQHKQ